MACRVQEQSIKLEAVTVTWGREQCRAVTMVDDVAGSLSGEYFDLNVLDIDGVETNYYVLLDNGSAVDPAPVGKTKIAVVYTDNDTAATIAGLMQVAVDAITDLSAEVVDLVVVHIQNDWIGDVTTEVQTNAASLSFSNLEGIGGNLGRTSEGVEISIETQSTEITSNQTGGLILDEIGQGQSASCTASFIELTKERLESLIAGAVGGTYTPSGGTKLIGGGSSKLFQSLKTLGGKLILHPQRLVKTDRTEDFVFWLAAPKPESINYSGTDVQALSCTFTAYLDDTKPDEVDLFAIGDWKQDL